MRVSRVSYARALPASSPSFCRFSVYAPPRIVPMYSALVSEGRFEFDIVLAERRTSAPTIEASAITFSCAASASTLAPEADTTSSIILRASSSTNFSASILIWIISAWHIPASMRLSKRSTDESLSCTAGSDAKTLTPSRLSISAASALIAPPPNSVAPSPSSFAYFDASESISTWESWPMQNPIDPAPSLAATSTASFALLTLSRYITSTPLLRSDWMACIAPRSWSSPAGFAITTREESISLKEGSGDILPCAWPYGLRQPGLPFRDYSCGTAADSHRFPLILLVLNQLSVTQSHVALISLS